MAVKTFTVGQLRKLIADVPDERPLLTYDSDGFACPIDDIERVIVTDQDGVAYLTLDVTATDEAFFGFDPATGVLDTTE